MDILFECTHLHVDVQANCVNECVSPTCFDKIYTNTDKGPLEPGEIDYERDRLFTNCVRTEYVNAQHWARQRHR